MLCFMHASDWIIHFPNVDYYSKVVAAEPVPASGELEVAEVSVYSRCWQSNLFIKRNFWVVSSACLLLLGFFFFLFSSQWNLALPYQDGWISFVDLCAVGLKCGLSQSKEEEMQISPVNGDKTVGVSFSYLFPCCEYSWELDPERMASAWQKVWNLQSSAWIGTTN